MSRYEKLIEIVRDLKPEHVVEIGTWNGRRAVEMMAVSNCYYTGFDLFEEASEETDKAEFNVKNHNEMTEVAKSIEMAGFSKFCLIRGNTNETLPRVCVTSATWDPIAGAKTTDPFILEPFDFAFIDGGHSVETIQNDFSWVKNNISPGGTIILDDWYDPEIKGMGCNFIEGEVIKGDDPIKGGGRVSLLRVDV